jgi:hypothetical protein
LKKQQEDMQKASNELVDNTSVIDDLKRQIAEKERKIEELDHQLKKCGEQSALESKENAEKFNQEKSSLIKEVREKDAMLENLNAEFNVVKEDLTKKASELEKMKGEFISTISEVETIRVQYEDEREKSSDLEHQLEDAKRQNEEELERIQSSYHEELQKENNEHMKELEGMKMKLERRIEERGLEKDDTMKSEMNQLKAIYESEINTLKESLEKQKTLNSEVEKQRDEAQVNYDQIKEQLSEKEKSLIEIQGQLKSNAEENMKIIEDLKEEVSRHQEIVVKLESDKEIVESSKEEEKLQRDCSSKEIDRLSKELEEEKNKASRMESLDNDAAALLEEIKSLKDEIVKKDKVIAELNDNLTSFEDEHDSEVSLHEDSLRKEQEKAAELEKILVLEFSSENAKHQDELDQFKEAYQQVIDDLKAKLEEAESANLTLQQSHSQEMDSFKSKLEEYTKNVEEQLFQLKAESDDKAEAKMKQVRESHEKEKEEMTGVYKKDIEALNEKLQSLTSEKEFKDAENDKLKKQMQELMEQQDPDVQRMKEEYDEKINTLNEQLQNLEEKHQLELDDLADVKDKQFMAVMEEILQKHQREIEELRVKNEFAGEANIDERLQEMEEEKRREINRVHEKLLKESEERIAEGQQILLQQINHKEHEYLMLREKANELERESTGITKERDRLLHEVQILTETRKLMDKERTLVEEPVIGRTIRQVVQEEPLLAASTVDQVEGLPPGAGFDNVPSSSDRQELLKKLQQMEEIIHDKNKIEVQLNKQLSETKKELKQLRESSKKDLQNKENRERTLESNKEQLEIQLSALERDSYDSINELTILQERLQEKERVVGELREEKNNLLSLLKENNDVASREKESLLNRSKKQDNIVKVLTCYISFTVYVTSVIILLINFGSFVHSFIHSFNVPKKDSFLVSFGAVFNLVTLRACLDNDCLLIPFS